MKFLMLFFMFFILSGLLIISNVNLNLGDSGKLQEFGNLWIKWIGKVSSNFISITGHAVGLDWKPE